MPTRSSMSSAVLAWLGLALVIGLSWAQASSLRAKLAEARASRGVVVDDEAFYRAHAVLGPEMPLLQAVRARLERGTPIAVAAGSTTEQIARQQRFWLALLPAYPVTDSAETEICPRDCTARAAEVLAEGDAFVWIWRVPERR